LISPDWETRAVRVPKTGKQPLISPDWETRAVRVPKTGKRGQPRRVLGVGWGALVVGQAPETKWAASPDFTGTPFGPDC